MKTRLVAAAAAAVLTVVALVATTANSGTKVITRRDRRVCAERPDG